MKIVHISTNIGSSSAGYRLHQALTKQGIESFTLIWGESLEEEKIVGVGRDWKRKLEDKTNGRFLDILRRRMYKISPTMPFYHGQAGIDVSTHKMIQQADVIHLHWICHFQSVRTIQKLIATGKPIVWTCHDSWPYTGGCSVRYGCEQFAENCGKCPILHSTCKYDITWYIFNTKRRHWKANSITFIAPSKWMGDNIKKSALFKGNRCEVIPNTINLEIFYPMNSDEIQKISNYTKDKEKVHILFGAKSAEIPYKGFSYLIEILEKIWEENPDFAKKVVLHIVGAENNGASVLQRYECHYWGYIREEKMLTAIYNIADIYVYPSIDDNLPNMIMESLACGTPVVAFDTGGITDMVEHKVNGYIAEYKNTEELKEGIFWVYYNNQGNCLGKRGREKVENNYSYDEIARRHIELYTELLNEIADKESKG